ncbi:MAG: hypothetical protein ACYDAO_05675 [Thermoplasmataceae archaeon]
MKYLTEVDDRGKILDIITCYNISIGVDRCVSRSDSNSNEM